MTSIIYNGKEHIAKFFFCSNLVTACQSFLEFTKLFLHFCPNRFDILPVKAYFSCFALNFVSTEQCRQALSNAVKSTLTLGLFLFFNSIPIYEHFCTTANFCVTKHVRMSTDKFIYNFVDNFLQIKVTCFFRHTCMEHYLHQHVAKFFTHACNVFVINSFNVFVNFFNEIATNGLVSLFNIPGATTRFTQGADNINKRLYINICIRTGIYQIFFRIENFYFIFVLAKLQQTFRHCRQGRNIRTG